MTQSLSPKKTWWRFLALGTAGALLLGLTTGANAGRCRDERSALRFATFNCSLNRNASGQLVADLSTTTSAQAKTIAEILQITRPQVLLLNELDYVAGGVALQLFQDNYLSLSQPASVRSPDPVLGVGARRRSRLVESGACAHLPLPSSPSSFSPGAMGRAVPKGLRVRRGPRACRVRRASRRSRATGTSTR